MKQNILKFSAILFATALATGAHAATASENKNEQHPQSNVPHQRSGGNIPPKLTAKNIQSAVEKRVRQLDGIDTSQLQIKTDHRTVTVSGIVDSLIESERVMEAVSAVSGVENVVTHFTVEAEPRSDAEVKADVSAALQFDPVTSDDNITVAVQSGEVRLTGQAASLAEKQLAGWIAATVRGVSKIDNDLKVESPRRSDAAIKDALEKRFRSDPLVSDEITVAVSDGDVKLSGEVSSALEKQWAILDARSLNVDNIDTSQLRVNAERRPSGSRAERERSDEEVAASIRHAYVNDPRVLSFNPDVTVKDGEVTLSGSVDNMKAKQAAVQIAQNTAGVKEVKDNLSTRGVKLADGLIARNLRDALARSVLVDAKEIEIDVTNGRATLTGDVDSNFEKWAAGDIAARTRGITRIQNELSPKNAPEPLVARQYSYPWHASFYPWTYLAAEGPMTDQELREEVRAQLTWSPFTDAEDISVAVADGVVTLTGKVDNRMEKGAAEDNAYQAGATRVKNQLVVLDSSRR